MSSNISKKHYAGLDALRALAILLVIPYHAGVLIPLPSLWPVIGNGWIGVELFFVLSGFLIGSQLMHGLYRYGHVDWAGFYIKRALRILPCFLVVLGIYYAWPGFAERGTLASAWRYLSFSANLGPLAGKTFSHVWSLCVEEHFYLAMPIVAWAVHRWGGRCAAPLLIGFALLGGLILRAWLWQHEIQGAGQKYLDTLYYPTYVHLDGLLVGVGLALIYTFRKRAWEHLVARPTWLFWGGCLALASGIALFPASRPTWAGSIGSFTLIGLGFGSWTMAAMSPISWLSRQRIPGVATISSLAYTLYLTHKQMIGWAYHRFGSENLGIVFATSIVLVPPLRGAMQCNFI